MEEYAVCIFGDLTFPRERLDEWRALSIDGRVFPDWPPAFEWTQAAADELVTVGAWLDDCARYEPGERLFLRVAFGPAAVSFRGVLAEPDYDHYRRELATIVRLAGLVGAAGQLTFASAPGERFTIGYR